MGFSEIDSLVINLKKQNYSVYSTVIGYEVYLWRPLTRFERETAYVSSNGDKLLYEELVCNYAVLWPKQMTDDKITAIDFSDYHLAGVPSILAEQILQETGYDSSDKFLSEMARCRNDVISNYVAQLETIVIAAFPQYKFEEMREWNLEQLCDMAAKAEYAIKYIHGNSEFSILDFDDATDEDDGFIDEETLSEDELLRQKEQELVEAGFDPIMILGEYYLERKQKPYLDPIFIMGTQFDNEVVVNAIGEQLRERQASAKQERLNR